MLDEWLADNVDGEALRLENIVRSVLDTGSGNPGYSHGNEWRVASHLVG